MLLSILFFLLFFRPIFIRALTLTVSNNGGNKTSPLAYGIMFEDINNSGDGGIYAELIRNRAFQGSPLYPSNLTGWSPVGDAKISLQNTSVPLSWALPTSVNVAANNGSGDGEIGIVNGGWYGIDVRPQLYTGSFWTLGNYEGVITAMLRSNITSETFASTCIPISSTNRAWTEHAFTLFPSATAPNINNTFVLSWRPQGGSSSLNLNLISLFPPTWNNRPNGLRPDLVQSLKDLNPSYLRFPGGNNLQGLSPPYRWIWNNTLGSLTQRPGRPGTWTYENTDGLGLIEYLLWCQDLGMAPVLAVWSGLYLDGVVISEDEIDICVQDVLNELEFLMGDISTPWGAYRASLGYTQPFNIPIVEVGNEDENKGGLASYESYRFMAFYNAITAKYPDIYVMPSMPSPNITGWYQPGQSAGDYHQYATPSQFVSEFGLWDNLNASNKMLIGEYATRYLNNGTKMPYPFWQGSVAEAVFLLGAERNGGKIIGASYAPLLGNLNNLQWWPDLLSFTADPAETVLSTSYAVVKLFSNNRITETLPVEIGGNGTVGPAYWVAGVGERSGSLVFKAAVYNASESVPFVAGFEGFQQSKQAELTVLTASDVYAMNVLGGPEVVTTNVTRLECGDGGFSFELPDYSVALLRTV